MVNDGLMMVIYMIWYDLIWFNVALIWFDMGLIVATLNGIGHGEILDLVFWIEDAWSILKWLNQFKWAVIALSNIPINGW